MPTWAYADSVPGPTLRASAGDLLRVTLDNQLPADTTVHWHGVRLRPEADGVPGLTQDPVRTGENFLYEFIADFESAYAAQIMRYRREQASHRLDYSTPPGFDHQDGDPF